MAVNVVLSTVGAEPQELDVSGEIAVLLAVQDAGDKILFAGDEGAGAQSQTFFDCTSKFHNFYILSFHLVFCSNYP